MRHTILAFVLGAFLMLGMGCAAVTSTLDRMEESAQTTELVVKYAILKYVGRDQAKAQRVHDEVIKLLPSLDNELVTAGILEARLRDSIPWERLDPADTLLMDTMLVRMRMMVEEEISSGVLDENDRVRLRVGAQWVIDAAKMAGAR